MELPATGGGPPGSHYGILVSPGVLLVLIVTAVVALLSCVILAVVLYTRPVADLFEKQPGDGGKLQPRALELLRSSIIGIYDDEGAAVCAAVFISDTRALTVEHDASPVLGKILHGRSTPQCPPQSEWTFSVVGVSKKRDLALLERVSGPRPSAFIPITNNPPDNKTLANLTVVLATFGIALAARAGEKSGSIELGIAVSRPEVMLPGKRHFVYPSQAGPGDSGSAVLSLDGKLIGLHQGGWNHANSPPGTPEKAGGKRAAAAKNKERLAAMGLRNAGAATVASVTNLARTLTMGGYAIKLNHDLVNWLIGHSEDSDDSDDSDDSPRTAGASASATAAHGARASDVHLRAAAPAVTGRRSSRAASKGGLG